MQLSFWARMSEMEQHERLAAFWPSGGDAIGGPLSEMGGGCISHRNMWLSPTQ